MTAHDGDIKFSIARRRRALQNYRMHLLLVGAEPPFSNLILQSLADQGFAIDVAQLVPVQHGARPRFDAVIVDLETSHSGEIAVIRKLRQFCGPTPILALTGTDADARVRSLRAGADDCLAKPVAMAELVERLKRLRRQAPSQNERTLRIKGLALDSASHEIEVKGKHHVLRSRESTILEILMTWPNRIVSKQRLEIDLYGRSTKSTSNAVEVGIHRLRKYLADADADVTIETARSAGYILRESGKD